MQSQPQASGYTDNLPLAVSVITLSVLALSLSDALVKLMSGQFVIWQIFVLRSLLVLPVLFLFLKLKNPALLSVPTALGWVALRSLMLVGMWIAYYLALPNLNLSVAAAAYYTLPIFIILFSAVITKDRICFLGWVAVLIGFCGVLLILQPRAGDFNMYTLLPLLSAVLYACAMILTRTKCRSVHPLMLSVALNISFVVVGSLVALSLLLIAPEQRIGFLLSPWTKMAVAEWVLMAMLAVAILIGSVGAATAYQKGPPSVIGIFDFTYVGFALVWSLVFFAEVPSPASMAGIMLIVAAGIMSLRQ
ncbi:EamA-like transporter family protein [Pseudovibrio axinellae]|uniref:EamA-like transporter family protein n=1 Tax=Pseudovibrio axinellae TaxID=989403 RepID=A0A165ULN5_9HYPH|nr:DMT family transporter [Pseudovibrio axinellae]KZL12520.1 EamA-like transporter family protein [Pseudovibrio axinellae]SEP68705.1 EamA domain-containing membrane protein RarD [Pseudovibrio axinellae]